MTTYFRPFNYRSDGAFERASKAWHVTDAGGVVEVDVDERRIQSRDGLGWIWIEGQRENFLDDPLRTDEVGWDTPAAGTELRVTPFGEEATVGVVGTGQALLQLYGAGDAVDFTWSIFAIVSPG